MLTSRMTEHKDRREWSLGGHEITRLLVDNRFGIEIWWRDGLLNTSTTLTIEAPFTIRTAESEKTFNPEDAPSLGAALSLLGRAVDSVVAYRNGLLLIRFGDGSELRVPKRQDGNETWESSGSGELHDIGMLCSSHEVSPWGGKA